MDPRDVITKDLTKCSIKEYKKKKQFLVEEDSEDCEISDMPVSGTLLVREDLKSGRKKKRRRT